MKTITENSKTFGDFIIQKEFSNGGSPIKKYLISKEAKLYLLRLFDPRFIASREIAFNNIKTLYEKGINVPEPIEFGLCNNNQNAFMILEWINGKSIEELLDTCDEDTEMNLGIQSGQELKQLHSIQKNTNPNLISEYKDKIAKKKSKFLSLGLLNETVSYLFDFLEQNLNVLVNNNSSIIHGDIHSGNIILTPDKNIIFIDLDVCKNDASWYDLASNSCLLKNSLYYVGLIDGYFKQTVPNNFWQVYTFYGCLYCLDYIQYSIRTEGLGLSHGLAILTKFINTTRNLDGLTPEWYEDSKSNYTKKLRREKI